MAANVCQRMESRKDHKWDHAEAHWCGSEPDQGQHQVVGVFVHHDACQIRFADLRHAMGFEDDDRVADDCAIVGFVVASFRVETGNGKVVKSV